MPDSNTVTTLTRTPIPIRIAIAIAIAIRLNKILGCNNATQGLSPIPRNQEILAQLEQYCISTPAIQRIHMPKETMGMGINWDSTSILPHKEPHQESMDALLEELVNNGGIEEVYTLIEPILAKITHNDEPALTNNQRTLLAAYAQHSNRIDQSTLDQLISNLPSSENFLKNRFIVAFALNTHAHPAPNMTYMHSVISSLDTNDYLLEGHITHLIEGWNVTITAIEFSQLIQHIAGISPESPLLADSYHATFLAAFFNNPLTNTNVESAEQALQQFKGLIAQAPLAWYELKKTIFVFIDSLARQKNITPSADECLLLIQWMQATKVISTETKLTASNDIANKCIDAFFSQDTAPTNALILKKAALEKDINLSMFKNTCLTHIYIPQSSSLAGRSLDDIKLMLQILLTKQFAKAIQLIADWELSPQNSLNRQLVQRYEEVCRTMIDTIAESRGSKFTPQALKEHLDRLEILSANQNIILIAHAKHPGGGFDKATDQYFYQIRQLLDTGDWEVFNYISYLAEHHLSQEYSRSDANMADFFGLIARSGKSIDSDDYANILCALIRNKNTNIPLITNPETTGDYQSHPVGISTLMGDSPSGKSRFPMTYIDKTSDRARVMVEYIKSLADKKKPTPTVEQCINFIRNVKTTIVDEDQREDFDSVASACIDTFFTNDPKATDRLKETVNQIFAEAALIAPEF